MSDHVNQVVGKYAQTIMYAMRVLRARDMYDAAINTIHQSIVARMIIHAITRTPLVHGGNISPLQLAIYSRSTDVKLMDFLAVEYIVECGICAHVTWSNHLKNYVN
jgi:hypothetical protein